MPSQQRCEISLGSQLLNFVPFIIVSTPRGEGAIACSVPINKPAIAHQRAPNDSDCIDQGVNHYHEHPYYFNQIDKSTFSWIADASGGLYRVSEKYVTN